MVRINVRPGEDVAIVLKKFRKICEKAEIIKDFKKNEFYEKPSDRKRRERRRMAKQVRKNELKF